MVIAQICPGYEYSYSDDAQNNKDSIYISYSGNLNCKILRALPDRGGSISPFWTADAALPHGRQAGERPPSLLLTSYLTGEKRGRPRMGQGH